jgi:hypothetical protein
MPEIRYRFNNEIEKIKLFTEDGRLVDVVVGHFFIRSVFNSSTAGLTNRWVSFEYLSRQRFFYVTENIA